MCGLILLGGGRGSARPAGEGDGSNSSLHRLPSGGMGRHSRSGLPSRQHSSSLPTVDDTESEAPAPPTHTDGVPPSPSTGAGLLQRLPSAARVPSIANPMYDEREEEEALEAMTIDLMVDSSLGGDRHAAAQAGADASSAGRTATSNNSMPGSARAVASTPDEQQPERSEASGRVSGMRRARMFVGLWCTRPHVCRPLLVWGGGRGQHRLLHGLGHARRPRRLSAPAR